MKIACLLTLILSSFSASAIECPILNGMFIAKDGAGVEHAVKFEQDGCTKIDVTAINFSGPGIRLLLSKSSQDPLWHRFNGPSRANYWVDNTYVSLVSFQDIDDFHLGFRAGDLLKCKYEIVNRDHFTRTCEGFDINGKSIGKKVNSFVRADWPTILLSAAFSVLPNAKEDEGGFLTSGSFRDLIPFENYGYKTCQDSQMYNPLKRELRNQLQSLIERRGANLGMATLGWIPPSNLHLKMIKKTELRGENFTLYDVRFQDNLGKHYHVASKITDETQLRGFLISSTKETKNSRGSSNCCLGYATSFEEEGLKQGKKSRLVQHALIDSETGKAVSVFGDDIFASGRVAFVCRVNFK